MNKKRLTFGNLKEENFNARRNSNADNIKVRFQANSFVNEERMNEVDPFMAEPDARRRQTMMMKPQKKDQVRTFNKDLAENISYIYGPDPTFDMPVLQYSPKGSKHQQSPQKWDLIGAIVTNKFKVRTPIKSMLKEKDYKDKVFDKIQTHLAQGKRLKPFGEYLQEFEDREVLSKMKTRYEKPQNIKLSKGKRSFKKRSIQKKLDQQTQEANLHLPPHMKVETHHSARFIKKKDGIRTILVLEEEPTIENYQEAIENCIEEKREENRTLLSHVKQSKVEFKNLFTYLKQKQALSRPKSREEYSKSAINTTRSHVIDANKYVSVVARAASQQKSAREIKNLDIPSESYKDKANRNFDQVQKTYTNPDNKRILSSARPQSILNSRKMSKNYSYNNWKEYLATSDDTSPKTELPSTIYSSRPYPIEKQQLEISESKPKKVIKVVENDERILRHQEIMKDSFKVQHALLSLMSDRASSQKRNAKSYGTSRSHSRIKTDRSCYL